MTDTTHVLNAYAKINLTLDVFSKRADGYHDIASVMQTISLHDTLHFTPRASKSDSGSENESESARANSETGIVFTCDAPDSPDVPTDATNLVVRAAQLLIDLIRERTGVDPFPHGLTIYLEKRIPSQAGLGGGSSDAATALRGVNALLESPLPVEELRPLAAQLGSDVSFFLIGGTAVARGRGEKLTVLPDAPPYALVVVKPDQSVSTGWAYNELDTLPNRQSHRGTKRMEEALQNRDQDRVLAFQSNDFELPIFQHHPALAWLHDELMMAGCLNARLCGSGAALYGIARNQTDATRIANLLRHKYPHTYPARTLPRAESLSESLAGTTK